MSVEEIQDAIAALSVEERARLRAWFDTFTDDEWDRQMEADAKSGKLDKLIDETLVEFRNGRFREI